MSVGELTVLLPVAAFAALAFGVLVVLRRAGRIVARTREVEHFRSADPRSRRPASTSRWRAPSDASTPCDAASSAPDVIPPTIEAATDAVDPLFR